MRNPDTRRDFLRRRLRPGRLVYGRFAAHLGFDPKDTSEVFRAKVEAQPMPAANDPGMVYQGGPFVAAGPFGDE